MSKFFSCHIDIFFMVWYCLRVRINLGKTLDRIFDSKFGKFLNIIIGFLILLMTFFLLFIAFAKDFDKDILLLFSPYF